MSKTNRQSDISKNNRHVKKYMTVHMGIDTSYDVGVRDFSILKTNVQIYYVNGLVDDLTVGELTKVLVTINDNEPDTNSAYKVIKNRLNNLQEIGRASCRGREVRA